MTFFNFKPVSFPSVALAPPCCLSVEAYWDQDDFEHAYLVSKLVLILALFDQKVPNYNYKPEGGLSSVSIHTVIINNNLMCNINTVLAFL